MLQMNNELILTEASVSNGCHMMSQEENRHVSQVKRLKPENRGISKAHFAKYLHHRLGIVQGVSH